MKDERQGMKLYSEMTHRIRGLWKIVTQTASLSLRKGQILFLPKAKIRPIRFNRTEETGKDAKAVI